MQELLPGFTPPALRPGPMHAAALVTLNELSALGLLEARHELLKANILGAALDIDNTPKATIAKTQLRAQIEELRRQLPEPVAAIDDAWTALETELARIGIEALP